MNGCVIEHQSAGEHGIYIEADNEQVNLKKLGVTWESSIRNSDTGDGIRSDAAADGNGYKVRGIQNPHWRNLAVRGADGDSYCYNIINTQLSPMEILLPEQTTVGDIGFWVRRLSRKVSKITTRQQANTYLNVGQAGEIPCGSCGWCGLQARH
jgi:hypothetical protein